jgi:hypothetical protein
MEKALVRNAARLLKHTYSSNSHIMKNRNCLPLFKSSVVAAAMASGATMAGISPMSPPPVSTPVQDVISGTLSLDVNSHFISYGADVWGDGSSMSSPTFNPSLELNFALPADLTFTLGTWWDVNSKAGGDSSPLGGRIQEVDVYYGLSYTANAFTFGVTYQNWMYGGQTEDILDFTLGIDTFLSPSLTVHQRLDEGASGGNTGTVLVLGVSHDIALGPVTVSIPLNVAYFLKDDFHFTGADDGFGYGSIGLNTSIPLAFTEAYGGWSLNGGLTYYVTSDSVVGNSKDNFLTASLGVSVDF